MKNKKQIQAILKLQEIIRPEDTLTIVLHSVASSGMSRKMSVLHPVNGEIKILNWMVVLATGHKLDKNGHIIVRGCGMDMLFALNDDIKRTLYPKIHYTKMSSYQSVV